EQVSGTDRSSRSSRAGSSRVNPSEGGRPPRAGARVAEHIVTSPTVANDRSLNVALNADWAGVLRHAARRQDCWLGSVYYATLCGSAVARGCAARSQPVASEA